MRIIVSQVLVALALIIVGAQVFVGAVEHLSSVIGLDPTILALVIAPIATELPEKFNSVLWVRTGKDTLAMGNITGAMVFQSCLPTVLGLLFTTWAFSAEQRARASPRPGVGVRRDHPDLRHDAARAGSCTRGTLLIGGPLYLVYIYLGPLHAPRPGRLRRVH